MKNLLITLLLSITLLSGYGQTIPNVVTPSHSSSTGTAYVFNISAYGSSYNDKVAFVKFIINNSGAATININGLGAKALRKLSAGDWVPLVAGDLLDSARCIIAYDQNSGYMRILDRFVESTGGGVQSVTGSYVDNTDPLNPEITPQGFQDALDYNNELSSNSSINTGGHTFQILDVTGTSKINVFSDDVVVEGTTSKLQSVSGSANFEANGPNANMNASGDATVNASDDLALRTASTTRLNIDANGAWAVGGSEGSSGNVLTSNGSNTPPTWQAPSGGGGSGTVNSGTANQLAYYAGSGTTVSGYTPGTGVLTALGVNVGSAGAPVLYNGAGGTPSAMVGTNITGIPQSGVTSLTSDLALKAPLASPTFTGTPTLPTGTIAVTQSAGNSTSAVANTQFVTTADNLKADRYLTTRTITSSGALVLADDGKRIIVNSVSPVVITIPLNASVAYPTNTYIPIEQTGAGAVSFTSSATINPSAGAGVYTHPGRYNVAGLLYEGSDVWTLINGSPAVTSGNGVVPSGSNTFNIGALTGNVNLSGSFGLGRNVSPTALFHIGAGTGSANFAPLKFTDGTHLATSESLVLEPVTGGAYLRFTPQANAFTTTIMGALTGSATLNFPSIAATGGTQTLTITVTDASAGDEVIIGIPIAAVTAGVTWFAYVSATGTVSIVATNCTIGALDPASGVFRASVIKR